MLLQFVATLLVAVLFVYLWKVVSLAFASWKFKMSSFQSLVIWRIELSKQKRWKLKLSMAKPTKRPGTPSGDSYLHSNSFITVESMMCARRLVMDPTYIWQLKTVETWWISWLSWVFKLLGAQIDLLVFACNSSNTSTLKLLKYIL